MGALYERSYLFVLQESGESVDAHFSLHDNVFAKAHIEPQNKVCLWLGVIYFMPFLRTS